jgi:hypothetical protein
MAEGEGVLVRKERNEENNKKKEILYEKRLRYRYLYHCS